MLSELAIAYLFLGGAGAGCAFVCSMVGIAYDNEALAIALLERFQNPYGRSWSRFLTMGLSIAILCILIGAICLAADLGQPSNILFLLFSPKFSWIAFGTWSIIGCLVFCVLACFQWIGVIPSKPIFVKVTVLVLAAISLVVMVYTGVLLAGIPAVPLWNSAWLVVLFFLSSLSCGIALVNISSLASNTLSEFSSVLRRLSLVDFIVIAFELVALGAFIFCIQLGSADMHPDPTQTAVAAQRSLTVLLAGAGAPWLWVCVVLIGLILPLVLNAVIFQTSSRTSGSNASLFRMELMLATSGTVLFGGLMVRYLIVAAAVHPILLL